MNYITRFRKPSKIVPLIMFLFAGAIALLTVRNAVTEQIEVTHEVGTWSYTTKAQQHGPFTAYININDRTVAGLKQYAETNKALAVELAKTKTDARFQLTFRKPVDVPTYRAWAKTTGISYFSDVILGMVEDNGKTLTGQIGSGSSDPLPLVNLDSSLAGLKQNGHLITSVGITQVRGHADSSVLPALANDPMVFLAEVTPNAIIKELRAGGASDADIDQASIENSSPIFSLMEQLGLANFR